jgi:hypothetical protein
MPGIIHARRLALLALPLALAGCHSGPSVDAKNATPEDVAKKVASSGLHLDPGRWEATAEVQKFDMPGMTPQMRDTVSKSMKKTTFASCLTPEQAAKPDAGFFESKNTACKFDTFKMADGKIDAKMTCSDHDAKQTMIMSGTYSANSYDMHMDMNGSNQGGTMSMSVNTSAKRVGACKGNENS